jgi:hypothetical protein
VRVTPINLGEARVFVDRHHRHHKMPQGGLFAVAISEGDEVRGVAIVGRPVARHNNNGYTAEVTRVCTLGDKNACSMLYGACWRAAKALGYDKLITYTLISEPGTSLVASGWKLLGVRGGGSWNSKGRPRVDKHPLEQKQLWEKWDAEENDD